MVEKEDCPKVTAGVEHAGVEHEAGREQTHKGHVEDCEDEAEPKTLAMRAPGEDDYYDILVHDDELQRSTKLS